MTVQNINLADGRTITMRMKETIDIPRLSARNIIAGTVYGMVLLSVVLAGYVLYIG